MDAGFPVLGYDTIPQHTFFLRRASPSQRKKIYPTLWETNCPHPLEPCSQHPALFLIFFFLSYFPPTCIIGELRDVKEWLQGTATPYIFPGIKLALPHPQRAQKCPPGFQKTQTLDPGSPTYYPTRGFALPSSGKKSGTDSDLWGWGNTPHHLT